jgi:hypothetical protein
MTPSLPRSPGVTRAVRAVLAVLAVLGVPLGLPLGAGCVHGPAHPEVRALTDADVALRLAQQAERRRAVEGVAKASLPGLGGAVLNATVDLAAQAPARLSVAVRSFFEAPQQIFVADGDTVTLYDATTGTPRFSRGPARADTLARVLGVALAPDDAVALILGRPPVLPREQLAAPRVRLVDVDDNRGTFRAAIERVGRGRLVVTARASDNALVALEVMHGDGRPLLRATCSDFVDVDGVAFAQRIEIARADGEAGLVLSMTTATWNPPALPDTAFVLDVPPGMPVEPL